jgi:signal recognition particle receptor subunit beta
VQFNSAQREITIKLVYYGPPLSGKTTNLQAIHKMLDPSTLGRLTVLDTADDRTLFFDLLPVTTRMASGYSVKLKLFTVPGQVIHATTRRVVLAGADGVAYVADSQRSMNRANNEFWKGMRQYLRDNGLDPEAIPIVIQFNKRDLPSIRTPEEIEQARQRGPEPIYEAVAIRGEGILETLHGLLELVFVNLDRRYQFSRKFGFSAEEFFEGLFGHLQSKPIPASAQDEGSQA